MHLIFYTISIKGDVFLGDIVLYLQFQFFTKIMFRPLPIIVMTGEVHVTALSQSGVGI